MSFTTIYLLKPYFNNSIQCPITVGILLFFKKCDVYLLLDFLFTYGELQYLTFYIWLDWFAVTLDNGFLNETRRMDFLNICEVYWEFFSFIRYNYDEQGIEKNGTLLSQWLFTFANPKDFTKQNNYAIQINNIRNS